jgi:hypothetical protein
MDVVCLALDRILIILRRHWLVVDGRVEKLAARGFELVCIDAIVFGAPLRRKSLCEFMFLCPAGNWISIECQSGGF